MLKKDKENVINTKQKDTHCSREDKCSFPHNEDKRAKPTQKKLLRPELPTPRDGSASRKRILRDRSPSGKFARQPCKEYLKGTCTKSPCDY